MSEKIDDINEFIKMKGEAHSVIKNKIKIDNNNNLIDYISLIKILSAFLVILKHTNRKYWVFSDYWISTNIICSFCMCAVPLFSLCIGATLLNFNKRYSIYEYLKKRFNKMVIPIIGWNTIYYFYKVYIIKNLKRQDFNLIYLYDLYFSSKIFPLSYSLRVFMFGYMAIPLIAYIDMFNKIKIYSISFSLLLINTSTIPYFMKFFNDNRIIWPYNYNLGYIIYLFAGYIIQNHKFNRKARILIYVFGLLGLLSRIIISHYLTMKYKKPDRTQINYVNLPIVVYSCSIFLFVKEKSNNIFKIIKKEHINTIGSLTMGPFFLHYIIIWGFFKLFNYKYEFSFIYRFYGAFIITIMCFIITFMMKKIPIIKILVP
jgi:hypothetical protein